MESDAAPRHGSPRAVIDTLRRSGDHRAHPVRFRLIEALARRSETHDGAVRRVLEARLAELLSDYRELLERAPPSAATPAPSTGRGALAELVAGMAVRAPVQALDATLPGGGREASSAPVVEALSYFRSTWSELSAARLLTQSLDSVPENAGPLNSGVLVHQALRFMQDVSPEYLHRFVSYVDELRWLGQMGLGGESSTKPDPTRPARRVGGKARAET